MTTIPWIVDLPPNDIDITGISRASFIRACQGHEKMGDLLAYFILIASHAAKDQRIDTTAPDCTFIDISCKFENIIKKVKISRKSLANYVKQMETLGYVDAPPYQRVYRVYFKKINAAIKSPPEEVKAKPRGKYAPPTVKPTQEEKAAQKRLVLQQKLVNLQHKLVSLQTKLVSLQKELVDLPTFQTAESTSQAGLEGVFEPLRALQSSIELLRVYSHVTSASAESDEGATFLSKITSFGETLEEVRQNGYTNADVVSVVFPDDAHIDSGLNSGSTQQAEQEAVDERELSAYENHIQVRRQVGHDGITSLTFEDIVQGQENGKAPLNLSASTKEEVRPEGLPQVVPTTTTNEPTQPSTEPPTQIALLSALQGKPTPPEDAKKTPSPNKTVGKGKYKIPEAKPLCSPRIIREAIDAIRGHALEEAGAMIHQNKVLKEWCQKHTLEDYQRVIEHVTSGYCANKEHQFWREGTNFSSFFNADKLAKLTPGILACTGHIPKPNAPPEVAPKEEPKIIGWQPQRRITPPRGVTVIYG